MDSACEVGMELIESAFAGFKKRPFLKAARVATPERPLVLVNGQTLSEVVVAYETYGRLSKRRDNVILVVHALTGDSHPAAHDEEDEVGWWEPLVGSGSPIDTDKFFVICANVLGGCQGTTGPASIDPATGGAYGTDFPEITIRDMVHVQKRLLDSLNIEQLVLVIGGSMGGMQALEWAVTYPDYMSGVVVIAAPGYSSAQAIAYSKIGRDAVMLDPAWEAGNYYGGPGPARGLSIARALGMITYQSEPSMENKCGRRVREGKFEIENYLNYQGERLVQRFDANTYLCLMRALDLHDLGAGYISYEAALARIKCSVLVVGVSSDILYPVHQQEELVVKMLGAGVKVEYKCINSPFGHDGFLIDFHILRPMVYNFVQQLIPPQRRAPFFNYTFRAGDLAYLGARLVTDI
jgi:homoserine O-acetyltransferase